MQFLFDKALDSVQMLPQAETGLLYRTDTQYIATPHPAGTLFRKETSSYQAVFPGCITVGPMWIGSSFEKFPDVVNLGTNFIIIHYAPDFEKVTFKQIKLVMSPSPTVSHTIHQ